MVRNSRNKLWWIHIIKVYENSKQQKSIVINVHLAKVNSLQRCQCERLLWLPCGMNVARKLIFGQLYWNWLPLRLCWCSLQRTELKCLRCFRPRSPGLRTCQVINSICGFSKIFSQGFIMEICFVSKPKIQKSDISPDVTVALSKQLLLLRNSELFLCTRSWNYITIVTDDLAHPFLQFLSKTVSL